MFLVKVPKYSRFLQFWSRKYSHLEPEPKLLQLQKPQIRIKIAKENYLGPKSQKLTKNVTYSVK